MDFIIGGAYQGKRLYCMREYGYKKDEIFFAGNNNKPNEQKVVCGFHIIVKEWLKNGIEPLKETEKLLKNGNIQVFISDEIGNGIVPMDSFERQWREETGRCCALVAQKADRVIRVFCQIATVIK